MCADADTDDVLWDMYVCMYVCMYPSIHKNHLSRRPLFFRHVLTLFMKKRRPDAEVGGKGKGERKGRGMDENGSEEEEEEEEAWGSGNERSFLQFNE